MTQRRRLVVVVIVALLAATGLSACAGGGGTYKITAYFTSAISLYKDSQVRVLGLRAGKVTSVKVEDTRVKVEMSIPDDIPLPHNVEATIIPLSFIGERYIQFFPAWKEGVKKLPPGSVLDVDRTSVPVEPDETLAALKHLLDSIDPAATGKLVTNLAGALDGTGEDLNRALAGLGTITDTLGSKSEQVAAIIDNFDRFTATLAGRDQTLGRVLDTFAKTTDALAKERAAIESLLSSLASLSTNGLDLLTEHGERLDKDLTVLSRTLRLVNTHIDEVDKLLASAPLLVAGKNLDGKSGLAAAYDKNLHAIDLRVLVTPNLAQVFNALGLPTTATCVPAITECDLLGTGISVPPELETADDPAMEPAAPKPKRPGGLRGLIRSISAVFG